ncbi:hypothetical protein HZH66_001519 [Vespula vulgaris]|uniref:Uncharacterized protein n=1 Tax=Vespula vulgaris TaxID=7454 RepID=A0A834NLR3_VESVU|nr:hypothetical protein HZH66_001519 [Vespula vulgaris]
MLEVVGWIQLLGEQYYYLAVIVRPTATRSSFLRFWEGEKSTTVVVTYYIPTTYYIPCPVTPRYFVCRHNTLTLGRHDDEDENFSGEGTFSKVHQEKKEGRGGRKDGVRWGEDHGNFLGRRGRGAGGGGRGGGGVIAMNSLLCALSHVSPARRPNEPYPKKVSFQ